jgi:hypothetical protein
MNMDQFVLAAKSIEADHSPLLSACDDVLAFISKTKDNLPPEHAAKVAEMLEGLQTYRADFVRETGGELARLKASIAQSAEEIAAASAEFDAEHAKATQTFADLEQNMPAMLAAAAEAAAEAAEAPPDTAFSVRPSGIPGGGGGLFATRAFPAGFARMWRDDAGALHSEAWPDFARDRGWQPKDPALRERGWNRSP